LVGKSRTFRGVAMKHCFAMTIKIRSLVNPPDSLSSPELGCYRCGEAVDRLPLHHPPQHEWD